MDHLFAVKYSFLIPLLPLLGAMVAGLAGARWLKQRSHWPIWIGVGLSAALSISLLPGMLSVWHKGQAPTTVVDWYTWIQTPTATGTQFEAQAGAFIDPLTAVMLCVVTGIGFLITIFSAGYMKGETGYFRFFAYMGLFIFAMTVLVMANNFVMLYLGWEGVGLCSYLLIGYYYERPSAREAAKKAFLVNRVGDFGFGLGIMLIWKAFHTVSFFGSGVGSGTGVLEMAQAVLANPAAPHYQVMALKAVPFLLMLGAFGKSAQFPLHVWLPDAMEGPTPVSALIHAATMVTAGVYMIARCSTLFFGNPAAMTTIAVIGAFTALFAATIALRQNDIKKVFAYSTISQLGYMFVGVAVLAPVAGIFHLATHAFFKALLFLSCGVVMHAMSGELDMRKMSGLRKVLPWTNLFMLIGCLALAGVPFLSGFFSKDDIIAAAFHASVVCGAVLLLTAFLTAYYAFRLYFQVFQGPLLVPPPPERPGHDEHHDSDQAAHHHEPLLMMLPLAILAIGAIFAGYINWPSAALGNFLSQSPSIKNGTAPNFAAPENPFNVMMLVGGLVSLAGVLFAYLLHLKDRARAERIAQDLQPLTGIIEAKYWVDEIYQAAIVEPLRWAGRTFYAIDRWVVDGLVDLVGNVPVIAGYAVRLSMQQGGYLQGYAAVMLLGIAAILLFIFVI